MTDPTPGVSDMGRRAEYRRPPAPNRERAMRAVEGERELLSARNRRQDLERWPYKHAPCLLSGLVASLDSRGLVESVGVRMGSFPPRCFFHNAVVETNEHSLRPLVMPDHISWFECTARSCSQEITPA